MTNGTTHPLKTWRTLSSTWKLLSDGPPSHPFYFGAGFGCGASMKITKGEKLSLQTVHKITSQIGGKLTVPGAEMSSSVGSEISETITHELSASYEWSLTSKPCEYCNPQVHFPNGRVRVLDRYFLHLPLFVTRKVVFLPGDHYEIQGHCRRDPQKCENCEGAKPSPGGNPRLKAAITGGLTFLERVIFSDRTAVPKNCQQLLKGILSTPDDETVPEQLYVPDLNGQVRLISDESNQCALYSLDDVDRALGAIRFYPETTNWLLFLTSVSVLKNPEPLHFQIIDQNDEIHSNVEVYDETVNQDYALLEVGLSYQQRSDQMEQLKLRIEGSRTVQEWPVIGLRHFEEKTVSVDSENEPSTNFGFWQS